MNKVKETGIFLILMAVFFLGITGYNFVHYYVIRDYPVQVYTVCNPVKNNCFITDPEIADPNFQATPYSKVEITASLAPSCLDEHTCPDFTCDGIVGSCVVKYCSEANIEEGESCSSQ